MKKVNFAPSSPKTGKGIGGNPTFILIALVLLMILCAIYFIPMSWMGKKRFLMFSTEICPLISIKRPKTYEAVFPKQGKQVLQETQKETQEKLDIGVIDTAVEIEEKEALREKSQLELSPIPSQGTCVDTDHFQQTTEKQEKVCLLSKQIDSKEKVQEEKKDKEIPSNNSKPASNYLIQVCSCVIKENADTIFKKMGDLGYFPVIKKDFGRIKMNNIYSEVLGNQSEAKKLLNKLNEDGFDPTEISLKDGRFSFRIATCYYRQNAQGIMQRLEHLGYRVRILNELTKTPMYSVLLGGFDSMVEAEATRRKLMENGYDTLILSR